MDEVEKMVEGGGEPHLRPQLLARDTRTSFLEHGYGDLRASKYFSGWDESRGRGGGMKSSFLPFFSLPLSSGESQTPWSHSWRANEVEKIKAAAGDH